MRFRQGGRAVEAWTRGEVILCAGAIGSVQILQLSGVGPGQSLQPLGIETVLDHPGVGRNLQDHLQQRAIYKVQGVKTLNETYHSLVGPRLDGGRIRPCSEPARSPWRRPQLGIFTTSSAGRERANIEFHVQPLSLDKFGEPLHRFPAITVSRLQPAPGRRAARSGCAPADPAHKPIIAPNYLATDEDRRVASDAIRVTRRLMGAHALARFHPEEILPGPAIGDGDAELARARRRTSARTIFHPVGTAKMGLPSDPTAVVDERLRVIGLEGLRVIDASVMPTITSGNTNTPTIMIAEKGSRMAIEDAKNPPVMPAKGGIQFRCDTSEARTTGPQLWVAAFAVTTGLGLGIREKML